MTAVLPEVYDLTDLDFEIEQPCEHFEHTTRTDVHEGPGYYYVVSQCPNCGNSLPIRLMCRKIIESKIGVHCGRCDRISPMREFWTVVGTIDGG